MAARRSRHMPASTPRDAVDQLIGRGMIPFPAGRYRGTRGRIVLRSADPATGEPRQALRTQEPVVLEGPPFAIDLDTVRVVKEREVLGRWLCAVSFERTSRWRAGRRVNDG